MIVAVKALTPVKLALCERAHKEWNLRLFALTEPARSELRRKNLPFEASWDGTRAKVVVAELMRMNGEEDVPSLDVATNDLIRMCASRRDVFVLTDDVACAAFEGPDAPQSTPALRRQLARQAFLHTSLNDFLLAELLNDTGNDGEERGEDEENRTAVAKAENDDGEGDSDDSGEAKESGTSAEQEEQRTNGVDHLKSTPGNATTKDELKRRVAEIAKIAGLDEDVEEEFEFVRFTLTGPAFSIKDFHPIYKLETYHRRVERSSCVNAVATSVRRILEACRLGGIHEPSLERLLYSLKLTFYLSRRGKIVRITNDAATDATSSDPTTTLKARIAVLGSTPGGSSLQGLLDAWTTRDHPLRAAAELVLVLSDKDGAGVIRRTREASPKLESARPPALVFVSPRGKTREEFDLQVSEELQRRAVDFVVLIGYMRILSTQFCETWAGRVINVHPSLLPEFAGGMDLQVHTAVLAAKRLESGCTVHLVTSEVDGGPVFVQKRCPVFLETDTPESLKARVQAMESPALIEAVLDLVGGKSAPYFPRVEEENGEDGMKSSSRESDEDDDVTMAAVIRRLSVM